MLGAISYCLDLSLRKPEARVGTRADLATSDHFNFLGCNILTACVSAAIPAKDRKFSLSNFRIVILLGNVSVAFGITLKCTRGDEGSDDVNRRIAKAVDALSGTQMVFFFFLLSSCGI